MKIILDTNFLMVPIQFKVDIFTEIQSLFDGDYELYIMEGTKRELENLSKSNKKDSKTAKLALELAESNNIKVLESEITHVDDAIVEIADENTTVATNDKKLKQKLKDKSVKVIYLRSKKYLELM